LLVGTPSGIRAEPRHRPRRRTSPLALRIELYERSSELRRRGLTYSEITETLRRKYNIAPSKGQLSEWLRGIHGPLGSANQFQAKPTPELAYVIGVTLGDGSLNRKGYNRRIRFQSVDLDFVLEFDRCLSAVLGTRRLTPWFDRKRREIHVEASSVLLHGFLNQDWTKLKPWICHSRSCVSMFLRGFFDSEGSVSKAGHLTCFNSDVGTLKFVQYLLLSFLKIESTGPHLSTESGTKVSNRGRSYLRQSSCYYIYVRAQSLGRFYRDISLTIERKRIRLEAKLGLQST
jgi:intein-encoded DNA endonuclease-like protein